LRGDQPIEPTLQFPMLRAEGTQLANPIEPKNVSEPEAEHGEERGGSPGHRRMQSKEDDVIESLHGVYASIQAGCPFNFVTFCEEALICLALPVGPSPRAAPKEGSKK
jgi:hypothetical protein